MRIITDEFLEARAGEYPKAKKYLQEWARNVRRANWRNLVDARRLYPATDSVKVRSGKSVLVFNVCGNDYRFIVAVHWDKQRVFTLRFLTHADYTKDFWKNEL